MVPGVAAAPVREVVHALLVPQVAGPGDVLVCDGVLFVTKGQGDGRSPLTGSTWLGLGTWL